MLSIITVTWNSYDFLDLLLESIEIYSYLPYQVFVVDNSTHKKAISRKHVFQLTTKENIGHGAGLNLGVKKAVELFPKNQFFVFFDVDCHILCHRWEVPFLKYMKYFDFIAAKGVPEKPIRPACMFMSKEVASKYNWNATPGYEGHRITPEGFDTAIEAFYKIKADGHKFSLMNSIRSRYETFNGEEWVLEGIPIVYHHWHGSHLKERQKDFPNRDLIGDKCKLFESISWRRI